MEQVKTIDGRRERHRARCGAAAGLRAVVALSVAGLGTTCLAADSMSSLGSAFRPQPGADASALASSGERSGGHLPGLRVIVSSTSRSVASIDGQIVHVGDTVNGMRVTQINQQGVLLVGEGGVQERLLINPSVVKRARPVKAAGVSNGAAR
jgi:hypothetical protein